MVDERNDGFGAVLVGGKTTEMVLCVFTHCFPARLFTIHTCTFS